MNRKEFLELQDIKRRTDQVPNDKYTEDHRTVEQAIYAAEQNQIRLDLAKKGFSNDKREAKEELKEAKKAKVSKEQYKLMKQDIKEILGESKSRIKDLNKTINRQISIARKQNKENQTKIERLSRRGK